MVRKLKTIATKPTLTILITMYFLLSVIGSIIYFSWLNNSDFSALFSESYVISSTITHLLGYISPSIILASIIYFDKEHSEKIFASALITGLIISTLTSFIVPAVIGSTFTGVELIGNIIVKIPAVFIVVDIFRKHKLVNVSCILCLIMSALQIVAFLVNALNTFRYAVFFAASIMPAILSVMHWVIVLFYLIRFVSEKEVKYEEFVDHTVCSTEQRLQNLKERYENGEISEAEYKELKDVILSSFV